MTENEPIPDSTAEAMTRHPEADGHELDRFWRDDNSLPIRPPPPQPVAPAERVAAVDVLRGVALLGILAMNIVAFAWPFAGYDDPHFSGGDDLANRIAWIFNSLIFDGKMMSLFSMLFGAGLVLMGDRAAARGASIRGVYYRRTFWLLVIGLIHAYLIWFGDILFFYAMCGFLLYPFRRLRPGLLIGLGAGVLLFASLIFLGLLLLAGFTERMALQVEADRAAGLTPEEWQVGMGQAWKEGLQSFFRPDAEDVAREIENLRGSYVDIVARRAPEMIGFQIGGFVVFFLWAVGGRMLLGMGLMKLGVFSAERSVPFYRGLILFGYGIGLPLTAFGAIDLFLCGYNQVQAAWGEFAFGLGQVPMALGHAGVVMLLCKSGAMTALTGPLAAVGRMALTNYLAQSLICTTLFYGYGLGWFGYLNRLQLWCIVVAIWGLQLVISPLWLRYFRYGPAEWLWRSLTYWKLQPMRNRVEHGMIS